MLEKKAKKNLSNNEWAHASGTETAEEKGSDLVCDAADKTRRRNFSKDMLKGDEWLGKVILLILFLNSLLNLLQSASVLCFGFLAARHAGFQLPDQELNLYPLRWRQSLNHSSAKEVLEGHLSREVGLDGRKVRARRGNKQI